MEFGLWEEVPPTFKETVQHFHDCLLAVKYDDEARKKSLEQKYGIMEIPMLIVLGANGQQVSDNGIRDLQNNQSSAIIEAWEKMAEAAEADNGQAAQQ